MWFSSSPSGAASPEHDIRRAEFHFRWLPAEFPSQGDAVTGQQPAHQPRRLGSLSSPPDLLSRLHPAPSSRRWALARVPSLQLSSGPARQGPEAGLWVEGERRQGWLPWGFLLVLAASFHAGPGPSQGGPFCVTLCSGFPTPLPASMCSRAAPAVAVALEPCVACGFHRPPALQVIRCKRRGVSDDTGLDEPPLSHGTFSPRTRHARMSLFYQTAFPGNIFHHSILGMDRKTTLSFFFLFSASPYVALCLFVCLVEDSGRINKRQGLHAVGA